jgi:hypothetical protein
MLFLVDWVRFWVRGMVLYQRGRKYEEGVSFRRGGVRFRVRFLVVVEKRVWYQDSWMSRGQKDAEIFF